MDDSPTLPRATLEAIRDALFDAGVAAQDPLRAHRLNRLWREVRRALGEGVGDDPQP